jgi:gamma-glutamyl:cysteine ligase YbdK (ATP-grasp superfamily)
VSDALEGPGPLGLWEGFGVEVEYMIVDAATLDVRPVADLLISAAAGDAGASDVDRGAVAWSNELALHVIELKTNGPAERLAGLADRFQASVREASEHLAHLGARLLAGGMHPWMDPQAELRLWPHEYNEVYRAFDRIFGCRGHGWANLQSTHVNLPFRGDDELFRLHEAIRLVLPLIPALAASSPALDGRLGPGMDNRLLAYRDNARWVPSVTGRVIPERVRTQADYRREVLGRIYEDMEPLDPEGVLRHEWVNARGATVRFERGAVEIRVIDSQECARADVAVAAAVVGAVRFLAEGPLRDPEAAADVDMDTLVGVLEATTHEGERARVDSIPYRALLGVESPSPPEVGEVWGHLLEVGALADPAAGEWSEALGVILSEGPLARRIVTSLGGAGADDGTVDRARLTDVYRRLADCVQAGEIFRAGDG